MKYSIMAFELILLGLITYLMLFTPSCLIKKKVDETVAVDSVGIDSGLMYSPDSLFYYDKSRNYISDARDGEIIRGSSNVYIFRDSAMIYKPIPPKKAKMKDIGYCCDGYDTSNLYYTKDVKFTDIYFGPDSTIGIGNEFADTTIFLYDNSRNFIIDVRDAWTKEPFNTNFILRREGVNMAEMNAIDSSITIHGDTMKLIRYLMNEIINHKKQ